LCKRCLHNFTAKLVTQRIGQVTDPSTVSIIYSLGAKHSAYKKWAEQKITVLRAEAADVRLAKLRMAIAGLSDHA
jgi:hypothetical protein